MKIAYLHGLESTIDPKDPKIIWLNDNFTEVYSPQINYKNPGEFDKILRNIKKMNPLYIVGSSMGGYFSYLIGSKLGIKTILFNPAVIGRSFEPVVNVGGIKGAAHNVYFGKSDKVIDGMEVRKYFGSEGAGDFQYNYYNGGHRVPADVFIEAIKETSGITEIYNIEKRNTTMIKKFDQFVDEANELKKPTYAPHMDSEEVFFLWDQHFDSRDGIEHGIVNSGNKDYSEFTFGKNINSTSFKYFKKDLEKLANKNRWDFSIDSDSLEIYESEVTEVKHHMVSGTSGRTITTLDNRKYELKKPVKGVKIGSFRNETLPKGTIIHNLPGGVFAMHPELEDRFKLTYSSQAPRWNHTFGVLVTSLPETLEAIEDNSKVLESTDHSTQLNRINESEVVYNQFDFEGMWAQKLGMTREEYVSHFATMSAGVDEAKVKDASGKKFEVKGVSFTYTDSGRFYGVYLYDVDKTSNVQWKAKLRSIPEAIEFLKLHGISEDIPNRYDENALDTICAELSAQGIKCEHNADFDVS